MSGACSDMKVRFVSSSATPRLVSLPPSSCQACVFSISLNENEGGISEEAKGTLGLKPQRDDIMDAVWKVEGAWGMGVCGKELGDSILGTVSCEEFV